MIRRSVGTLIIRVARTARSEQRERSDRGKGRTAWDGALVLEGV